MGTCSDAAKSLLNNGIVIILVPEEEEEEEISVASNTTGEKLVTAPSIIPGEVLPMIAYTWRLRPKGVSFSGLRYIKG